MKVHVGKDGRPSKNAQNLYALLRNQSVSIQTVLLQSSLGADPETFRALLTQIKDNIDNVLIPGLSSLVRRRRRLENGMEIGTEKPKSSGRSKSKKQSK